MRNFQFFHLQDEQAQWYAIRRSILIALNLLAEVQVNFLFTVFSNNLSEVVHSFRDSADDLVWAESCFILD